MAPVPNPKRELTLMLLNGPTIVVKITSEAGDSRTWGLPKALLSHHSGYFQRACRSVAFLEGQTNTVNISEFEPESFEMFVEFIYFGRYTYKDDLTDHLRIRDSAKAWVLGDYLDAIEFKNFAMRNLFDIYLLPGYSSRPKSGISPAMVDYCCSMSAPGSKLWRLIIDVMVRYWHDNEVIYYHEANRDEWKTIWNRHHDAAEEVMYLTCQSQVSRFHQPAPVEELLEKLVVFDEAAAPAASAPASKQGPTMIGYVPHHLRSDLDPDFDV